MTIDIYSRNKIFHLTDEPNEYHIQYKDRKQLKDLLDKFAEGFYTEVYVYHSDLTELFKNFRLFFNYIESAGGVVFNKYGQILFLKKNQIWDLPKGKIEKGETPEEAAVREVSEETGLDNLVIVNSLPSTYHIFKRKDKKYLKKIYWYKMLYKGYKNPRPLKEEGITDIQWVNPEQLPYIIDHIHPNLTEMVKKLIA